MKVKDNPFLYFLNRQLFDGNNVFKKVNIIVGCLKKLLGIEFSIFLNYRHGEKN